MEYHPSFYDSLYHGAVIDPSWRDSLYHGDFYDGWYDDALYHHGIKGMKWGVRRNSKAQRSQRSGGSKKALNTKKYGAREDAIGYKYNKPGESGWIGMKRAIKSKMQRKPANIKTNKSDSSVTKRVKQDYRTMDDDQFFNKYYTSKKTYAKRVKRSKTGDPYRDRINSRSYKALRKITGR